MRDENTSFMAFRGPVKQSQALSLDQRIGP